LETVSTSVGRSDKTMTMMPARNEAFISSRTRLLPEHCALWWRVKPQPSVSWRELACTVETLHDSCNSGDLHVSKAPMLL
jgi:hypothetical protein